MREKDGTSKKLKNQKAKFVLYIQFMPFDICRNLRADVAPQPCGFIGHVDLYDEVLRCNSEAFDCRAPGKQGLLCQFSFH